MMKTRGESGSKKTGKKKVLVTGGNGVIGKPLVDEIRRRGHEVWVVEPFQSNQDYFMKCDVRYYQDVERVFKEHRFDYVFHLAAEFGRKNGEEHYQSLWETNAAGTRHVLAMQEEYRFRMIFPSSSEVYGINFPGVMTEKALEKYAPRLSNDYGLSKWVNEQQIMNSAARTGTESVRWRFSNVYGPGEYYTPYRSVICQFIYRALHDIPYTVNTSGTRAFLYIDDAMHTVVNIMENFKAGEVYNIANRKGYTMKQVSDKILALVGKDDKLVTYQSGDLIGTKVKDLDNTKAVRELGHKETVKFDEGLRRTVQWFKDVYDV